MPYLSKKVTNVKVWELYAGQSLWFFVVGVVFAILGMLLKPLIKPSPVLSKAYGIVETIGTGRADASHGSKFASALVAPY